MNIRLNGGYMPRFNTAKSNEIQTKRQVDGKPDISSKLVCTGNNKYINSNSYDALSSYNLAYLDVELKKNHIPNGHSRYEYNGAKLDVVKNGDNIKSQMIAPENFKKSDFIQKYSNLEEIYSNSTPKTGSSISSVNGLLDEYVIQYKTGDCWLVSALYGLNATETGKQIIKNAITVNDDSTVTVNFDGIGVSYTITEAELNKHDTDSNTYDAYSNGDNDVLAMELATEKLWKDINSGKVTLNSDNPDITYTGIGNGIDDGGLPSQMIYYLTGIESDEYYNYDISNLSYSTISNALQNALDKGNTSLTFGVYGDNHSAKLTDGTTYSLDLSNSGHSLAITGITEDTVTFINPWDTSNSYTMSWNEFAKLGIGYLSSTDLSSIADRYSTTNDQTVNNINEEEVNVDDTTDDNTVNNIDEEEVNVDDTTDDNTVNNIDEEEVSVDTTNDEKEIEYDDYSFDFGFNRRFKPHHHRIVNDFNKIFNNDFNRIFNNTFGMLNRNYSIGFQNTFNNVFGFSQNFGFNSYMNNMFGFNSSLNNRFNSFTSNNSSFYSYTKQYNIRNDYALIMEEIQQFNPW